MPYTFFFDIVFSKPKQTGNYQHIHILFSPPGTENPDFFFFPDFFFSDPNFFFSSNPEKKIPRRITMTKSGRNRCGRCRSWEAGTAFSCPSTACREQGCCKVIRETLFFYLIFFLNIHFLLFKYRLQGKYCCKVTEGNTFL